MFDFLTVKAMMEDNGITAYEVYATPDLIEESIWFTNFDDFITFVKSQNINCAFIHVHDFEVEDYLITDNIIRKTNMGSESIDYLSNAISEYNESLLDENTNFAEHVFVMVMWNNQRFCYIFQNIIRFQGEELLNPEEKLLQIFENNRNDLIENKNDIKEKVEQQKACLRDDIINDPEFKKCTNKRLRRNYIIVYFNSSCKYDELKRHWTNSNGLLYHEAYDFIELLWREYKNK